MVIWTHHQFQQDLATDWTGLAAVPPAGLQCMDQIADWLDHVDLGQPMPD